MIRNWQAQIDYLAREISRKDILPPEMDILREFFTQLQQQQQSFVQGEPCCMRTLFAWCVLTGAGEGLLTPNDQSPEHLKHDMVGNFGGERYL